MFSSKIVSNKSHQVLQRFTGQSLVAKVFRNDTQRRDEEFLMFSKQQVDSSIVRYLQSTKIEDMPVVITVLNEGLRSYAAMRNDLIRLHPGQRFAIATKLLRRLFSGLDFLHFHSIIHGDVSQQSVLLQGTDDNVKQILLVICSVAYPFSVGEADPNDAMVADGKAAVELVDDCSELWTSGIAAPKDAHNEMRLRQRTLDAVSKCDMVKRCLRKIEWNTCQAEQLHNGTRREIGYVFKAVLDNMIKEYTQASGASQIADTLTFEDENHSARLPFNGHSTSSSLLAFTVQSVLLWLATTCELCPKWCLRIITEAKTCLHSPDRGVMYDELRSLQAALLVYDDLPPRMSKVFVFLLLSYQQPSKGVYRIELAYQAWYHVPSRMFNVARLQLLASLQAFRASVSETRCSVTTSPRSVPI